MLSRPYISAKVESLGFCAIIPITFLNEESNLLNLSSCYGKAPLTKIG